MLRVALAALLVSTDATPLCGKCVKKCGKRSYVCAGSYSCRSCQCHCVGEEDELPGAFSELAASLNDHGVKLAPAAVWGNMHSVAATIEHNATLTYPDGEIDDDATKDAINTLHRYRLTRAHKANDQKVEL